MTTFNDDICASLFAEKNVYSQAQELQIFIDKKKQENVQVRQIPFHLLKDWSFDNGGNLYHESGKFFTVCGLQSVSESEKRRQTNIILNQPEIGILGILAKKIKGTLHFLMQLKFEPGNIGNVQLSPTVQATKSNYTGVHKGLAVPYLEHFFKNADNIFDIALSEQASRFYKKLNRNIIKVHNEPDDLEVLPNFKWFTLKQLLDFIKKDNMVNMNTRSIISCIQFDNGLKQYSVSEAERRYASFNNKPKNSVGEFFFISALNVNRSRHTTADIKNWITEKREKKIKSSLINLKNVDYLNENNDEISSGKDPEFKIISLKVDAEREISSWCQPIIKDNFIRINGFLVKKINGVFHFLIKFKEEIGSIFRAEIGPTIQGIPIDRLRTANDHFIKYFINPLEKSVLLSVFQSDEGGRFFKVQNHHIIISTDDEFKLPDNYMWATLFQIKELIHLGYVNIEARSIISCINFNE